MEQSRNRCLDQPQGVEVYHYSVPLKSQDIICEGSDAEETPEETHAKRQRYEKQAKRYMAGHLPRLQSASLKGPFDNREEWKNPWMYKPALWKRKGQGWWRPGSQDMPLTRKDVIKKTANHGMGHLSPQEALDWCKKTAALEAKHMHWDLLPVIAENDKTPRTNVVSDEVAGYLSSDGWGTASQNAYLNSEDYPITKPMNAEYDAGSNRTAGSLAEGTKRRLDSQWLKGSHISKRIRWDGPPSATPTPLHIRGNPRQEAESIQNQNELSANKGQQSSERAASRPQLTPQPIKGVSLATHSKRQSDWGTTTVFRGIQSRTAQVPCQNSLVECHDEIPRYEAGGFEEEPWESISATSFRYDSSPKSRTSSFYVGNDLRPSSLPCYSEETPFLTQQLPAGYGPKAAAPINPPPTPGTSKTHQEDSEMLNDVSFVTEVAPSSRGLEKFEYRKKQRNIQLKSIRLKREALAAREKSTTPGLENELLIQLHADQPSTQENLSSDDEWDATIEGESYDGSDDLNLRNVSRSPVMLRTKGQSPKLPVQLPENRTTRPRSDGFDANLEDAERIATSSLRNTTDATPVKSISRSTSVDRHSEPTNSISALPEDEPTLVPPSMNKCIRVDSDQHVYSREIEPLSSTHHALSFEGVFLSAESMLSVGHQELLEERLDDKMNSIQRSLSQRFPSVTSDESSWSDQGITASLPSAMEEREAKGSVIYKEAAKNASQSKVLQPSPSLSRKPHPTSSVMVTNAPQMPSQKVEYLSDHSLAASVRIENKFPKASETKSPTPPSISQAQSPWLASEPPTFPLLPVAGLNQFSSPALETPWRSDHVSEEPQVSGWQASEPQSTPRINGIVPFRYFMSPDISPEYGNQRNGTILNTQDIIDTATINPWASCMKKPRSVKSHKRVSFGVLQSNTDDQELLDTDDLPMPHNPPRSPPPPEGYIDPSKPVSNFAKHFTYAKKVKRILPDKSASQMNCSPAPVTAMADAFLAADCSVEDRERPIGVSLAGKHPVQSRRSKTSLEDNDGGDSFPISWSGRITHTTPNENTVEFNVDEAISELDDFLEDWSVETELKKGREAKEGRRCGQWIQERNRIV